MIKPAEMAKLLVELKGKEVDNLIIDRAECGKKFYETMIKHVNMKEEGVAFGVFGMKMVVSSLVPEDMAIMVGPEGEVLKIFRLENE